jgi:hypothetical protein
MVYENKTWGIPSEHTRFKSNNHTWVFCLRVCFSIRLKQEILPFSHEFQLYQI